VVIDTAAEPATLESAASADGVDRVIVLLDPVGVESVGVEGATEPIAVEQSEVTATPVVDAGTGVADTRPDADMGQRNAAAATATPSGETRRIDVDRLVVVGSGVGAAIAAQWTMLDAAWPDIASGRQGRQVRGLVFVSPAWTTRGFTINSALAGEPVRRTLPVLVIGGSGDADAVKIYDQLKRQRPNEWFEQRVGQAAPAKATKLQGSPRLYLLQRDSDLTGDRLASMRSADPRRAAGDPAALIQGFINAVATPAEEE